MDVAAIFPLVLVAVAFVAYCLWDLTRTDVRWIPKWVWALIIVLSIPLGGIIYLALGRDT